MSILTGACSGQSTDSEGPAAGNGVAAPDPGSVPAVAKAPPAVAPELPDVADRDRDHDGIDDAFPSDAASVELEVILKAPAATAQLEAFTQLGGQVRHVFSAVSYGWTGRIARDALPALRAALGADLHLIAAPKPIVAYLDEATRTGRVRPVWAPTFGGLTLGASGNANITIAILDSGVDDTHPDLAGRMSGWKDYTTDNNASAGDVGGHGTHVASIALGSGAAFGLGPGTLKLTNSGTLASTASNGFMPSAIHTPAYFGGSSTLTVTSTATFLGGASATLAVVTSPDPGGGWTAFGTSAGVSPRSIGSASTSNGAARFSNALSQTNPAGITLFSVNDSVANYPAVGDGFNALRGVAPGCKWFGAKVFTDAGAGNTGDIAEALDDMVALRVSNNIKIVNMSLGVATGVDTTLRAKANTAVNNGIVVVVAAGNSGPSGTISDPGLANKVLTIGATNDKNELTSYTSVGLASSGPTTDDKPDLLAPGGSSTRSLILAADTNTKDASSTSFADTQSNDYSGKQGTSMAAPFAAGAAALLIDAMQQSGTPWTAASSAQPLFVKMLLLASATETNGNREQATGANPTLGRAAAPRDLFEGFGILNPDAAVEAFTTVLPAIWTGTVSNTLPARLEWERRAWGRKVALINGAHLGLTLSVPTTADLDLYVYSAAPDGNGVPVLRASSATAGLDSDETISFTSVTTETAYVFVKRVSGHGAFSLASTTTNKCGNGAVDAGEECDPGSGGATTCCSASCQAATAGTTCTDGNACTQTDSCQAGVCVGASPKVCAASDQCHDAGACTPSTGVCSNPIKTNGATCNDGNACTQTDTCQAGTCTGASPKACAASDQCHDAGTCSPSTGACSNPIKTNGATCNDANACTQTDTCQAGTCTGASPKVCAASDQCHAAGTCDAGSGMCSNPAKANGAACNDANACTQTDSCQSGACVGSNPITCSAPGVCQLAGTCSPATGQCSALPANDGTPCANGTCSSGQCLVAAGGSGGAGAGGEGGSSIGGTGGSSGSASGGESNGGASNGGEASGGEAGTAPIEPGAGGEAGTAPIEPSAGGEAGEPVVTGRAGAASAGEAAIAGGPAATPSNGQDAGCGCSEAGSAPRAPLAWGLLLALTALTVSRRRPRLSAD